MAQRSGTLHMLKHFAIASARAAVVATAAAVAAADAAVAAPAADAAVEAAHGLYTNH